MSVLARLLSCFSFLAAFAWQREERQYRVGCAAARGSRVGRQRLTAAFASPAPFFDFVLPIIGATVGVHEAVDWRARSRESLSAEILDESRAEPATDEPRKTLFNLLPGLAGVHALTALIQARSRQQTLAREHLRNADIRSPRPFRGPRDPRSCAPVPLGSLEGAVRATKARKQAPGPSMCRYCSFQIHEVVQEGSSECGSSGP